jgi:kynurenine formamidase
MNMSRRSMLKNREGSVRMSLPQGRRAACLILLLAAAGVRAGDDRTPLGKVVDLTHTLREGIPIYPGGEPFRLANVMAIEKGKVFYGNKFSTGEHTGTHVDAPSHIAPGGADVDALTPNQLIGPAAVIDMPTPPLDKADVTLSLGELRAWETKHGAVPDGAFVVLRTGWGKYWKEPAKYVNVDANGKLHSPGFAAEAIKYLVVERKIRGVGIDTLSIDIGSTSTFDAHKELLGAGKIALENLANLESLPEQGATIIAMPLKISRGSGSPVRVLAILPAAK